MILQGYAQSGAGEHEFLRDSIEKATFYSKKELMVTYRNGEIETYHTNDPQIHTLFLLNDEGKTLKVLWRQPIPEVDYTPKNSLAK